MVLLLVLPVPGFPRVRIFPGSGQSRDRPQVVLVHLHNDRYIYTCRTGTRGSQLSRPALLQLWRPVTQCGLRIHIVGNLSVESCDSWCLPTSPFYLVAVESGVDIVGYITGTLPSLRSGPGL